MFLFAQPYVFAQVQSMFGQKETPSQVRVFALAGAIGIEPTQWESEAQVLPLHQAPSRVLLYINTRRFAIDFVNRKEKIILQRINFEINASFLLQKCVNCCILQWQSDFRNLFCDTISGCSAVWFAIRAETKRAKSQEGKKISNRLYKTQDLAEMRNALPNSLRCLQKQIYNIGV